MGVFLSPIWSWSIKQTNQYRYHPLPSCFQPVRLWKVADLHILLQQTMQYLLLQDSGGSATPYPTFSKNKLQASSLEKGSTLIFTWQPNLRHASNNLVVRINLHPLTLIGIPTFSKTKWFHTSSKISTDCCLLITACANFAAFSFHHPHLKGLDAQFLQYHSAIYECYNLVILWSKKHDEKCLDFQ